MTKGKNTAQLTAELKDSDRVETFIEKNRADLHVPPVHNYIQKLLTDKGLSIAWLARQSGIDRRYAYDIVYGKSKASRDKLIAIALAIGLDTEQTRYLLKYAGCRELYVRDIRDSLLQDAVNRGYTVMQANNLLVSQGEKALDFIRREDYKIL